MDEFWGHFLLNGHVSKAASINKFHFPKKGMRIFLMEYLDWLEATFQ